LFVPPRAIVSYLLILSSFGVAKNSMLLPALALKLSIVPLLTPPSIKLLWFLHDIRVSHIFSSPIFCDNWSAIQIVHNDVFHEHVKHMCAIIFCMEVFVSVILLPLISWSTCSPKQIDLDGSVILFLNSSWNLYYTLSLRGCLNIL
jgi:hypothetical protein